MLLTEVDAGIVGDLGRHMRRRRGGRLPDLAFVAHLDVGYTKFKEGNISLKNQSKDLSFSISFNSLLVSYTNIVFVISVSFEGRERVSCFSVAYFLLFVL